MLNNILFLFFIIIIIYNILNYVNFINNKNVKFADDHNKPLVTIINLKDNYLKK
jgi:hypothetical protein